LIIDSNFKKCNNFCQILTQELDFAIGTRPDTKLCQILGQELKALPGTRTSSSGTKLSTLNIIRLLKKASPAPRIEIYRHWLFL
jgi:hypothetical protein